MFSYYGRLTNNNIVQKSLDFRAKKMHDDCLRSDDHSGKYKKNKFKESRPNVLSIRRKKDKTCK